MPLIDGYAYIDRIAEIDAPEGKIPDPARHIGRNCIAFSPTEDKAFAYTEAEARRVLEQHGRQEPGDFRVWKDAVGNLFVTYYGKNRSKTLLHGSHLDSVPDGGKYDGVAGVASALEFIAELAEHPDKPETGYTMVVWRAEESPATANPCLGSIIATGQTTLERLRAIKYENGGSPGLLRQQFRTEIWDLIEDEVSAPPIRDGKLRMPDLTDPKNDEELEIVAAFEDHIEQSGVLRAHGADVGVVTDIGGSVRERIDIPALKTASVDVTDAEPARRLTLRFTGEAAHTGGAPMNRTEDVSDGHHWYRRDALLAAGAFLEELHARWTETGLRRDQFRVLRCSTPMDGGKPHSNGYTTVTPEQEIELLVPESHMDAVSQLADDIGRTISRRKRVDLRMQAETAEGAVTAFDTEQVLAALGIPAVTERIVRTAIAPQEGTGMARYTITDFWLAGGKLHCKVDLRHTDPKTAVNMRLELDRVLTGLLRRLGAAPSAKRHEAESEYVPLDQGIAIRRAQIASMLGYTVETIASMPGHDARSAAKAGLRTGMGFWEHDGISHNPAEDLDRKSYRKGARVTHLWIAETIGLPPRRGTIIPA